MDCLTSGGALHSGLGVANSAGLGRKDLRFSRGMSKLISSRSGHCSVNPIDRTISPSGANSSRGAISSSSRGRPKLVVVWSGGEDDDIVELGEMAYMY